MDAITPQATAVATSASVTADRLPGVLDAFARATARLKKDEPNQEMDLAEMGILPMGIAPPLYAEGRLGGLLGPRLAARDPQAGQHRKPEAALMLRGQAAIPLGLTVPQGQGDPQTGINGEPEAALSLPGLAVSSPPGRVRSSAVMALASLTVEPLVSPSNKDLSSPATPLTSSPLSQAATRESLIRKDRLLPETGLATPLLNGEGGPRLPSAGVPADGAEPPHRQAGQREPTGSPLLSQTTPVNGDLVYRFQRWGHQHSVTIQPQPGGLMTLQSSDALVFTRLDQRWHDGDPQKWQLTSDDEEGPRGPVQPPQREDEDA